MRQCFPYDKLYVPDNTHCLYFIFYMKIVYVQVCANKYNTIQFKTSTSVYIGCQYCDSISDRRHTNTGREKIYGAGNSGN